MVQLEARTDITVDSPVRVNIHQDNSSEKPRVLEPRPSRFAEQLDLGRGRLAFRDWGGEVKSFSDDETPGVIAKGNTHLVTTRIATRGAWSGKVWVNVELRGRFTRSEPFYLPLRVSEQTDGAPFLRN